MPWRAGQVFQCVERRLCFVHAPLQDFNAAFESSACIAYTEIYAAAK
jgi:hypothetical protein